MRKNIRKPALMLLAGILFFCTVLAGGGMQAQAGGAKAKLAIRAYQKLLQKGKYAQGGFFVADLNKDGIKELFVTQKLDSSDFMMKYHHYSQMEIYTYAKGKVKRLKNLKTGVYNFKYGGKSKSLMIDLNAADREVLEIFQIKKGKLVKTGIFDSGHDTLPKFKNCISKKIKYFKTYKIYQKSVKTYGTKEIALVKNSVENCRRYLK